MIERQECMLIHIISPCQMLQIGRKEVHMDIHTKQADFEMGEAGRQLLASLHAVTGMLLGAIEHVVAR